MFLKKKEYLSIKFLFALTLKRTDVIAENPKLAPYSLMMARNISKALDIPVSHVNVKAKTEEGLGYVGKGKAIIAQSACLIQKKN